MGDIRFLVARALRDMELAERYRQRRQYATTTLLYSKAIDRVLRALSISKGRKNPPVGASAAYMAARMRMPDDIVTDLLSLREVEDETAVEEEAGARCELPGSNMRAERKLLQMDELATRIMDMIGSLAGYAKA
jgi:HEPN domain-containing protein